MQRVSIAIASPGDVQGERDVVPKVFTRWNGANDFATLHPVMWEHAAVPTLGDHPQHILNETIINKCDLLVALFWSKVGTPTPTASSGTAEEIREFIKRKGARRVMVYFCRRDLPYDIDPSELHKLKEFKELMRNQGLYHEYLTVDEFERVLYQHLDTKVQEFVTGQLPLPRAAPQDDPVDDAKSKLHPDPRLRELIDFGTSLQSISNGFAARMDEFDKIDGCTRDKFYNLGAHVYTSCASCLDRFLAFSAARIDDQNRVVIERMSSRLKQLAAATATYLKQPFPKYWNDGRQVSNDLAAHVIHLSRLGQI
jgi:hypothetical protein